MESSFAITELDRRVSNLIQIGTVVAANYEHAKLKVKIGDITTDWLPWLVTRASNDTSWWAPEVGEQVIVLAPSGELHQAVIMPSIYQSAHPAIDTSEDVSKTVYKDGTTTRYDRDSHLLTVDVNSAGKVEVIIGASTITMVDASIELKNGGSSILVTDSGIKLSSARIDFN
ncbi:MAG: Phage baseplate assembly protein [Rickettsiaceae bacterium]|nr:Phage baseplate assembly protein [Rickettsiaceae bacterium]